MHRAPTAYGDGLAGLVYVYDKSREITKHLWCFGDEHESTESTE